MGKQVPSLQSRKLRESKRGMGSHVGDSADVKGKRKDLTKTTVKNFGSLPILYIPFTRKEMKQVTFANCDRAGFPPLWFETEDLQINRKRWLYYTRPLGTMHQFTDNVGCNYMLHPSQNSNILCTRILYSI